MKKNERKGDFEKEMMDMGEKIWKKRRKEWEIWKINKGWIEMWEREKEEFKVKEKKEEKKVRKGEELIEIEGEG